MSIKKRSGPVRQLSLPQSSNRILQKQSSVDLYDRKNDKDNNNNNVKKNNCSVTPHTRESEVNLLINASSIVKQNSENTENAPKKSLRTKERSSSSRGRGRGIWAPPPRPVRLAWGERGPSQNQNQSHSGSSVQVVAERCKGQSRPQTAGPTTSREMAGIAYNRNTILYSRKQFAERIRQAWREREFTKPNLEIFLANPTNLDSDLAETRNSITGIPLTTHSYNNYKHMYSNGTAENDAEDGILLTRNKPIANGPNGSSMCKPDTYSRDLLGCSTPYSVLSSELRSELARTNNLEPRLQLPQRSFPENVTGPSQGWESELDSNFRHLVNHSNFSDNEEEANRPTTFLVNQYNAACSKEDGPSQSPNSYNRAKKFSRSGNGSPSTAESSSFESNEDLQTWVREQEPIPASTKRQNFRNTVQKAIDKSVTRPITPSTPAPQPQMQNGRSTRRSNQCSIQISSAPTSTSTPVRANTSKSSPVIKRLWSVPSQSFDAPSSEAASSYRGYERNIKSAPPPKRRLKAVRRKIHKPFYGNTSASDEDSGSGKVGTTGRRRTAFSNGPKEVETMISLLSPTDSETEVDGPDPLALLQANDSLPLSPPTAPHLPPQHFFQGESPVVRSSEPKSSREEIREIKPPPMLFLRKSAKPVSFKLLGLSAKSHSSLYPFRRSEPLVFEDEPREPILQSTKGESPSIYTTNLELTETRLAHKTLVSTKTAEILSKSGGEEKENEKTNRKKDPEEKLHSILIQKNSADEVRTEAHSGGKTSPTPPLPATVTATLAVMEADTIGSTEPEFKTTKERECWDLFRKMVDKGVSVSFDTVLRGMLTPTEYRLRKASEDSYI